MARLSSVFVGILLGLCACATPPPGRIIPLVPGFPLPASTIGAEPGEQLTWVNGDPARGEIQLEFDRVPNMPDVSARSGTYTVRFSAPGTYTYTVTSLSRGGLQLVPRRGEVVVRERFAVAAPVTPKPEAASPSSTPQPAPSPQPGSDAPPIGADITRLKGSAEVYTAYHYQPGHGIILKLERGTTRPSTLRPGSQVILAVTYTILAPREAGPLTVKEIRTIRFGDQDLRQVEKVVTVASGTYSSEHQLTVPADAAEGPYTVTTIIEVPSATGVRGQVSSTFSVSLP